MAILPVFLSCKVAHGNTTFGTNPLSSYHSSGVKRYVPQRYLTMLGSTNGMDSSSNLQWIASSLQPKYSIGMPSAFSARNTPINAPSYGMTALLKILPISFVGFLFMIGFSLYRKQDLQNLLVSPAMEYCLVPL